MSIERCDVSVVLLLLSFPNQTAEETYYEYTTSNYFWVNHKQTYKTEVGDGYL